MSRDSRDILQLTDLACLAFIPIGLAVTIVAIAIGTLALLSTPQQIIRTNLLRRDGHPNCVKRAASVGRGSRDLARHP